MWSGSFLKRHARGFVGVTQRHARHKCTNRRGDVVPRISTKLSDIAAALQENSELANKFADALGATGQRQVCDACAICEGSAAMPDSSPSRSQLKRLALLTGLPMVGFGFMDNAQLDEL